GSVSLEDRPGALKQFGEQFTIIKPGQGGIGDGLDVAEPVLQPGAADRRRDHAASRSAGYSLGHSRLEPGWQRPFQRHRSAPTAGAVMSTTTVVNPGRRHSSRIARSRPAVVVSISAGGMTTGMSPVIGKRYLIPDIDAHLPVGHGPHPGA